MRRAVWVALVLMLASFTTLYLVPDDTRAHVLLVGGPVPRSYESIQLAVDAADPGDIIYVFGGEYDEHVIINKTVSLYGEDVNTTIIGSQAAGNLITITADFVNITGFTITGTPKGSSGPIGIKLDHANNCRIEENNITELSQPGIHASSSNDNVIRHNRFSRLLTAVKLLSSHRNRLLQNEIFRTSRGFLLYDYSDENLIERNSFLVVGEPTIHLRGSNNTIANNTIGGTGGGMEIRDSRNNTIVGNTIFASYYAIRLEASYDNLVYHNTFMNNHIRQTTDDTGENRWHNGYPIGGNYWSDYEGVDEKHGPDQDQPGSDGIGDDVYRDVWQEFRGVLFKKQYPLMQPLNVPPRVRPYCFVSGSDRHSRLEDIYWISGQTFDVRKQIVSVEIRFDGGEWTPVSSFSSDGRAWRHTWNATNYSRGEHVVHVRSFNGLVYSDEVAFVVNVERADEPDDYTDHVTIGWILLMAVAVAGVLKFMAILVRDSRRR